MKEPDVSAVIVSWNTEALLRNCLKSLYDRGGNVRLEVIVVDNASSDGSVRMVRSEFPQAVLVENRTNRGFATANNQGINLASGRYVLLLNSDTEVLDGAVAKAVRFADGRPDAAVVGCRVLNPDGSLQPTCFMFPSVLNLFLWSSYLYKICPRSRFFGRERMSWWDRNNERQVEVVTGCFMLIRRHALDNVGVMDERFFIYAEETDLCHRFRAAGWKNTFFPGAEIVHHGGASSGQVRHEMILQKASSTLLFMKKHKSRGAYLAACLLIAGFFLLRVPYWLCMAAFASGGKHSHLTTSRTYMTAAARMLRAMQSA
jgi:hypothetical protein